MKIKSIKLANGKKFLFGWQYNRISVIDIQERTRSTILTFRTPNGNVKRTFAPSYVEVIHGK